MQVIGSSDLRVNRAKKTLNKLNVSQTRCYSAAGKQTLKWSVLKLLYIFYDCGTRQKRGVAGK